jgi:hypothetical protein
VAPFGSAAFSIDCLIVIPSIELLPLRPLPGSFEQRARFFVLDLVCAWCHRFNDSDNFADLIDAAAKQRNTELSQSRLWL